ncbi:hypothetical protein ACFR9U_12850 [Halorientalis brevis]|uniref:Ig-like domain repeat protein n=1 Tax=Halorientalis brevis TaxID=1126241 RepID=A0ABD6CEU6_9EURY|nr:hypothetical protein [Halorientalis brevis]
MPDETNGTDSSLDRRNVLKGLTVSGAAIAGLSGLSASSVAQESTLPAPFCEAASLPPVRPPGGQAGQCINCVPCDNPIAVKLVSGLSGTSYTIDSDEIPENAEHVTFKAGQNCFLGEVPENPTGDVTWQLEQDNGQPPKLQDISNATFYTCGGQNPPTVDDVKVTCDKITFTTSNIEDVTTLNVAVKFSDQPSDDPPEDFTPTLENGQATVNLPGNRDPIHVTITDQNGLILFDEGVTASDAPCGDAPAVTGVTVRCASITIQTANIQEGEPLDVTVTFSDDSQKPYTPEVDANGVAEVTLPGYLDPEFLEVQYDGQTLFEGFVAAEDAPCAKCPPDLNIAFKYKYGTWWPDTYDDIGEEVDPDVFSIDGGRKEVTICGPFPFAVSYATRTKKHHDGCDGGKHHDGCGDGKHHDKKKKHHDDKDGHDEWNSCGDGKHHEKKKRHNDCDGKKKHHKHHDCKSCGCFKDCEEQEPVTAEKEDGQYCATISATTDGKKNGKICWFRLHCPENDVNG